MNGLKKALIYAVGIGAGSALTFTLLFAGWFWYSQRPKPWNSKAITAKFELAEKLPAYSIEPLERKPPAGYELEDQSGFNLWYVVTNNANEDYEISPYNVTVHAILKASQALTFGTSSNDEPQIIFPAGENNVKESIIIPAGKSARLRIHLPGYATVKDSASLAAAKDENYYAASPRVVSYLQSKAPDLGGFVIFDKTFKYEIDLPWGSQEKK